MHVRMGWSGEIESNVWRKITVELEEEDLRRLTQEHGLPAGVQAGMSTKVCYQLMQNDAEVLMLNRLKNLGYPAGDADSRITALNSNTMTIMNAIKKQLASVE